MYAVLIFQLTFQRRFLWFLKSQLELLYSSAHWAAGSFKSDWNVEQQPIYFWVPCPLRNCPKKKLKSSLGKIWVFLKFFLDFWIFLKIFLIKTVALKIKDDTQDCKNNFEKLLLNKFFKNQKLGFSDLDQNVANC